MSDQPRPSSRPSGATLWLGVLLVLSLTVNTFFIGLIAGGKATSERWAEGLRDRFGVERHMGPGGPRGMTPDLDPRSLTRILPESAQDDARAILAERGPEIRAFFFDAMDARTAVLDAMRAEPFDRAGLEQALAASRAADAAASAAMHGLMAEIVANLTPEERAQIGADLRERFPEYRDRREQRERWRERHRRN